MNIPTHLRHLRTDRRGLPVPFINRWGPEDADRVSIAVDPVVGRHAVMYDDTGYDTPDFTAQHFERQRACMVRGWCQVCATPVPWRQRNLVLADISIDRIVVAGAQKAAVVEPWLCSPCADFAITVCPALIRRHRGEDLQRVRIRSRQQVTLVQSQGHLDGRLFAESARLRPTMWVKALLPPSVLA